MRQVRTWSVAAALALIGARAWALDLAGAKPSFTPGLYETESRNSAFEKDDEKTRQCLAAADYDGFLRETLSRYQALPQFKAVCRLSATRPIADGFAFAMDCGAAETIVSFHFAKNLVGSTTRTRVMARPDYSSTIVTLSRRIGDCPE